MAGAGGVVGAGAVAVGVAGAKGGYIYIQPGGLTKSCSLHASERELNLGCLGGWVDGLAGWVGGWVAGERASDEATFNDRLTERLYKSELD